MVDESLLLKPFHLLPEVRFQYSRGDGNNLGVELVLIVLEDDEVVPVGEGHFPDPLDACPVRAVPHQDNRLTAPLPDQLPQFLILLGPAGHEELVLSMVAREDDVVLGERACRPVATATQILKINHWSKPLIYNTSYCIWILVFPLVFSSPR